MKKSVKASLLSALIFPGLGHLSLKKYIPGSLILLTSVSSLYFVINDLITRALLITDQVSSGKIGNDVMSLMAAIEEQSARYDPQIMNIAISLYICSWIFGIIDSYRIGNILDKQLLSNKNEAVCDTDLMTKDTQD